VRIVETMSRARARYQKLSSSTAAIASKSDVSYPLDGFRRESS
jgi:hypothetical protein